MTKKEAKTLAEALTQHFGGDAEFEAVNSKGRYRFAITSDRFNSMPHLQRQDEIWEVVDQILSRRQARMEISMILAYAPKDLMEVK